LGYVLLRWTVYRLEIAIGLASQSVDLLPQALREEREQRFFGYLRVLAGSIPNL